MLENKRSKAIEHFIKTHPEQKIPNSMYIPYGGKIQTHDVYYIPIEELLIHNIRNGRFRSELLEKEEALKRKLDPTNKEHAKIIRQLLLDQNSEETTALRNDLLKNGQLDPGIITYDGAVMNANRRMAILQTLFEETREDKYKYLKVGILPPGVDELDLWKIEAGLQFGRDFRLQYGGVNELLKLREGEQQGLSAKDISVALLARFSEKQVKEKLDILKLIDSYLLFIEKKGEYHRITEGQMLEKFNSLQKNVIGPLNNKHSMKKRDILEITSIAFSLMDKTEVTHWDIRDLQKISVNSKAYQELSAPFKQRFPGSAKDLNIPSDKLQEAFTSAQEIIENEKEKDKPERLLKRAKSALDQINEKTKELKQPEMRKILNELKLRLNTLIKAAESR